MNWDQIEGNWKQAAGALRRKWGALTDDDLSIVRGNRDLLIGKLQERYGVARDEAHKQITEFAERFRTDEFDAVATEGDPVDMKTLKIGM